MLALLRGDDAYGMSIRQEIERRSGHSVAIGAATPRSCASGETVRDHVLSDPLPCAVPRRKALEADGARRAPPFATPRRPCRHARRTRPHATAASIMSPTPPFDEPVLGPRHCTLAPHLAAPAAERAYLLDDLDEEFGAARDHGRARATVWVISQTVRSLGPLAVAPSRPPRRSRPRSPGRSMLSSCERPRFSMRVAIRVLAVTHHHRYDGARLGTTTASSAHRCAPVRPLSFARPEQLMALSSPLRNAPFSAMVVNHADIADLRQEMRSSPRSASSAPQAPSCRRRVSERAGRVSPAKDWRDVEASPNPRRLFATDE